MNSAWQLPSPALLDNDGALIATVEQIHRALYEQSFRDQPSANHALPIETRAARRLEEWRVFLLLTPWMLARLLIPGVPPSLNIPSDWLLPDHECSTPILGPLIEFNLANTSQKAHLNHHSLIGHYLIQPLVLAMEPYRNAEEVYEAWNEVIRTRDENMRRRDHDCQWQREVSRRELFRGLLKRSG